MYISSNKYMFTIYVWNCSGVLFIKKYIHTFLVAPVHRIYNIQQNRNTLFSFYPQARTIYIFFTSTQHLQIQRQSKYNGAEQNAKSIGFL